MVKPTRLVIDNSQNFNGKLITKLCDQNERLNISIPPYKLKMNEVVEVANNNLKNIFKKIN